MMARDQRSTDQALKAEPVFRLLIVVDHLQEVVRTARAVQPRLVAIQHRHQLKADASDDTDPHQPAVEPALQPTGREREQQIHQPDDPHRLDGQPDRVQPRWRGVDQQLGEPGKAGEHHDLPDPVLRPSSPGGKPAAQQRSTHQQSEHRTRLGQATGWLVRCQPHCTGARQHSGRRQQRQLNLHCRGFWRHEVTRT